MASRLSICNVSVVYCDYIGWNSSKIIARLVSLGVRCVRSLLTSTLWIYMYSKGNTRKFGRNRGTVWYRMETRKLCYSKDDRAMRAVYRELLWRYGHSKLSKMAEAAILNLFEPEIAPLDPPSPKTPS